MKSFLKNYKSTPTILTWLVFVFPFGLFLMWKYAKWDKNVKWAITGFYAFLFVVVVVTDSFPSQKVTSPTNNQDTVQVTQEFPKTEPMQEKVEESKPAPTPEPVTATSSLDRITQIVNEKAGVSADVFSGDNFANDSNAPYDVIVNLPFDHSISSCFMAKSLSVDVVKALYMDATAREDISRVIITIPYYLRMSLGANDGVPMAEKNVFNGPTVYWDTLERLGLGEDETGKIENRTWGVYLDKCK